MLTIAAAGRGDHLDVLEHLVGPGTELADDLDVVLVPEGQLERAAGQVGDRVPAQSHVLSRHTTTTDDRGEEQPAGRQRRSLPHGGSFPAQ
jgi:hypothetical protein